MEPPSPSHHCITDYGPSPVWRLRKVDEGIVIEPMPSGPINIGVAILLTICLVVLGFLIPPTSRLAFICLATLASIALLALVHMLGKMNRQRGDYFTFNHQTRTIRIPRQGIELPRDRALRFEVSTRNVALSSGDLRVFFLALVVNNAEGDEEKIELLANSAWGVIITLVTALSDEIDLPFRTDDQPQATSQGQ